MKKIKKCIAHIYDELDGSKMYAEKYIIYKNSNPSWAKMYKQMAEEELIHAEYLKTMTTEFIDSLTWKSEENQCKWDELQRCFADRTGMVRLMLSK